MMKKLDDKEHKLLALWAADCAEHAAAYAAKSSVDPENEIEWQQQKRSGLEL